MSRLDWKRGRFDSDFETNEIHYGLRAQQSVMSGDHVEFFRFDKADSETHDIYDEGFGAGRVFHPPVRVPVLHVTHDEGGNENRTEGFYWNDNIYITASYEQFKRTGLTQADIHHERYLKDRVVYDGLVFQVTSMSILGQIQQRDTIVSIEGTQLKPDELKTDPQFASYLQ